LLVRRGSDARLPNDRATGKVQHTLLPVYREMILEICRIYRSLPSLDSLELHEIRFFYNGIRGVLHQMTE
jgi:hypothetical protein